MTDATDLARARVQTVDVIRIVVRRLNAHAARLDHYGLPDMADGYRRAAGLVQDSALDIADDLARERAQTEEERT